MPKYLKSIIKKIYLKYLINIKKIPPSISDNIILNASVSENKKENVIEEFETFKKYYFNNIKITLFPWPIGTEAVFNINFDDLCPIYLESENIDFGGKPGKGINLIVDSILKEFPELKVTHFVIPNVNPAIAGINPDKYSTNFSIDNIQHTEWIKWLKNNWINKGHEIAVHGYSHYNKKLLIKKHTEFAYTSPEISREKVKDSLKVFENIDLPVFGFRPPGWDISSSFELINILKSYNFMYIAGSALDTGINYGEKRVSDIYPDFFRNRLLNIPQNLIFDFSMQEMEKLSRMIIEKNGILSLKGHYTNLSSINNSLTKQKSLKIISFIKGLREEYSSKLWYATMKEIAHRWINLSQVKIFQEGNILFIKNDSQNHITDLVIKIESDNYTERKNFISFPPKHKASIINLD